MKTNIYNKKPHIEGYIGSEESSVQKSDVQKAFEAGNDTNEVMSYGKEKTQKPHFENAKARDGFDNTGTQGYDSLSDDAYNSADQNPTVESAESQTGSSSEDFKTIAKTPQKRNEDDALNTGI